MHAVVARLVALETDRFPGWARLELEMADGSKVQVHEKQPVLGLRGTEKPGEFVNVACQMEEGAEGTATVRLLHGVETVDGASAFTVKLGSIADVEA